MNLAQNLTQHIADPENIIIVDGALPDKKWINTHTPFMASNVLPNPKIPTYYVIDLSLISKQFAVLMEWLTANNSLISFQDSFWFITLGHELKNSIYETQIEDAIKAGLYYAIQGEDLADLVKNFDTKNYPFYYQIQINNSGIPDGIKVVDQYNAEITIFSVALIKSIFALWDINPSQRENINFVFTKVTNDRDESTVAFKVYIENKVSYYDYSTGPTYNILNASKSKAACIK
ncbi:hypothetical protein [Flavobacterium sp.]|jgi:hypothetical protein|uniref:hypothetical protein n=1 Tax=Flavobacterium sp. TaxID=239 RepID=UPI0033419676